MGRLLFIIIGVSIAAMILYVEKFYLHPSPELVHFVQRVTITDPWTSPQKEHNTSATTTSTASTMATGSESGTQQGNAGNSAGLEKNDAAPKAVFTKETESPLRYSAKLHMINPLQILTDYPVAWFLCVKMGFAKLWWVTANLVSCIHPLFGLAAGLLIARSAKMPKPTSSSKGGSPAHSRVGSSCGSMVLSPKFSSSDSCAEDSALVSIMSSPKALASPHSSSSCMVSPQGPQDGSTTCMVEMEPLSPSGKSAAYMQHPGKVQVNLWTLRLACCLFSFRNFLDGLDGAVARLQRRYRQENAAATGAATVAAAPLTFGFNGHSVDVVTDLLGVVMCCLGIFVFMHRCGPVLSRHSQLLANVVARGCLDKKKMEMLGKIAAVCGLLFMAVSSGTWETFMIRYSNLFDLHSPTNPAIWQLEQSTQVRLNMFLWSITCGDSIFTMLIICLFFNRIWDAVQALFFLGYPWLLVLALHSNYVWHWVILTNPEASKIIAQTAQFE